MELALATQFVLCTDHRVRQDKVDTARQCGQALRTVTTDRLNSEIDVTTGHTQLGIPVPVPAHN